MNENAFNAVAIIKCAITELQSSLGDSKFDDITISYCKEDGSCKIKTIQHFEFGEKGFILPGKHENNYIYNDNGNRKLTEEQGCVWL